MDTQIFNNLDNLLKLLSNKYLGIYVHSSDLLLESNLIPNSVESKFMIQVLISDAYVLIKEEAGKQNMITISPLGYRFFHSGGYFVNSKTELYNLTQEAKKEKLEITNLKYGFIMSIAALLTSIIALFCGR